MIHTQLERLMADSAHLESFANTLREEGEFELHKKVLMKKSYLDEYIRDKKQRLA